MHVSFSIGMCTVALISADMQDPGSSILHFVAPGIWWPTAQTAGIYDVAGICTLAVRVATDKNAPMIASRREVLSLLRRVHVKGSHGVVR
jgi:hypothetical protein